MQRATDLDVVVETRQCLDEHVSAFVCELVTTGREEVQRLVEIKVKMSTTHHESSGADPRRGGAGAQPAPPSPLFSEGRRFYKIVSRSYVIILHITVYVRFPFTVV